MSKKTLYPYTVTFRHDGQSTSVWEGMASSTIAAITQAVIDHATRGKAAGEVLPIWSLDVKQEK